MNSSISVSVIIPAYNEALGIADTLHELYQAIPEDMEVIVVDDGSKDETGSIVDNIGLGERFRCIHHKKNRGYGGAIKTGTKYAKGEYVVWYDADGQHRPEDLLALVEQMKRDNLDYCIGIRGKDSFQDEKRVLGKAILKWFVNSVSKEPIKDFNSGLRGFKRSILKRYLNLLPEGFGASTVTTLLMQELNLLGGETPIVVRKRVGKSTVKILRDGFRTIRLIMDMVLLFKPVKVFGAAGLAFIVVGAVYGIWKMMLNGLGIPVLAAILLIFGIQTFFLGIILSQISKLRLEGYMGNE